MHKERRQVYDYYYEQQFLFRIGHVRLLEAGAPMFPHEHGNMTEFVYMEKGSQNYSVGEQDFVVNQGEVFFTRSHETHCTGNSPEEVSALYYLIVDLSLVPKMNLFVFPEEYARVNEWIQNRGTRIFKAAASLPGALDRLLKCFSMRKGLHFDTHIRNALSDVLIALSTPLTAEPREEAHPIARSLRYIQEHLGEPISVADLPPLDEMSLSSYHKYFLQAMGVPPGEYILKKKIEKARALLSDTNLSVTEIAFQCGFSSSQYFATAFKRFCRMTPSQFRESMKAAKP